MIQHNLLRAATTRVMNHAGNESTVLGHGTVVSRHHGTFAVSTSESVATFSRWASQKNGIDSA
jgi:hypothetical protein